jgi:hypothetical protein
MQVLYYLGEVLQVTDLAKPDCKALQRPNIVQPMDICTHSGSDSIDKARL